jgi:hypothetical protein
MAEVIVLDDEVFDDLPPLEMVLERIRNRPDIEEEIRPPPRQRRRIQASPENSESDDEVSESESEEEEELNLSLNDFHRALREKDQLVFERLLDSIEEGREKCFIPHLMNVFTAGEDDHLPFFSALVHRHQFYFKIRVNRFHLYDAMEEFISENKIKHVKILLKLKWFNVLARQNKFFNLCDNYNRREILVLLRFHRSYLTVDVGRFIRR